MRVFRFSTWGHAGLLVTAMLVTGCGSHRVVAKVPEGSKPAQQSRVPQVMAQTLESQDQHLAAALLAVAILPRADTHRQLAREYRRVGVLDKAHEHFSYAVALDPADAASYDGLARIWRDWGTPQLGLGDAYRAVHYAPASASAANTLGTLLQAAGFVEDAKLWYARAVHLDPQAWYAMNNLCYAAILTRESAVNTCQAAVGAAPGTKARTAQNNLALAHAAAGDMHGAKTWFRRASDPATASYNYGIAMMAARAYEEAAAAFDEAVKANPDFTLAAQRARQARAAARNEDEAQ